MPLNGQATNNAEIAEHLRQIADWIEEGRYNDVHNVFTVIELEDGEIYRNTCGAPCDKARALGVLTIAVARSVMSDEPGR